MCKAKVKKERRLIVRVSEIWSKFSLTVIWYSKPAWALNCFVRLSRAETFSEGKENHKSLSEVFVCVCERERKRESDGD